MSELLREDTRIQQSRLANYCRTGDLLQIKGLTDNRVQNYRRLVYNVINDTLQSAYPLTYDLLNEDEWNEMVDIFFSNHACQSAAVWKMPFEFYRFIESDANNLKEKYPFLTELLLFEWMEIELYMMEDKIFPHTKAEGEWEKDIIEFNPEFKLLQLSYPVHLKKPNRLNDENKAEYYLLIFREQENGKIQFINLSIFFAWLIEKINAKAKPVQSILKEAENILGVGYQTLLSNTLPFLEELRAKQFIIGFRR